MTRPDPRPLIAHVVHRFDTGGLENGVVNLVNRLAPDRYRHAIVALTQITDFRERIQRDDVQFVALDRRPGQLILETPRLVRVFRALRPAVVHTRNIGTLEAAFPALLAGVPVRVHGEHGWDTADPDGSNWKYRITRFVFRPVVSRWVALSQHLADYLHDAVGIPASAVTRICNGVDTERFAPAPAGIRTPIEGSPFNDAGYFVVGTVGRLQEVKDQPTLVRAVAHAIARSSEARARMRLVLVGDGPLRPQVEAAIAETGMRAFTWLAGSRDDVPAALRGLDCFVLPSIAEGISNTILEALACGLPVVATRVGGNVELIEEGRTGLLVPASDPAALGEALLRVFAGPTETMRRDARATALHRFGLERMVNDYSALYDQLLVRAGLPALGALSRPEQ